MAGRNPREAADAFLVSFKQTLACVTDAHVIPSGYEPEPALQSVTLVPRGGRAGDPAPLRTEHGRRGLWLSVGHDYRIVAVSGLGIVRAPWQVSTARYVYDILNAEGRELLTYHWHPEDPFRPDGRSKVQSPHLHLSDTFRPIPLGRDYAPLALAEAHVRTGQVLLEDVVTFLIEDCGIHPLKDEWREIVEGNRERASLARTQ